MAYRFVKSKYSEAKPDVDFALTLDAFDFMASLHKALKAEIEYELGNYENCRNIIISLGRILILPQNYGIKKKQKVLLKELISFGVKLKIKQHNQWLKLIRHTSAPYNLTRY